MSGFGRGARERAADRQGLAGAQMEAVAHGHAAADLGSGAGGGAHVAGVRTVPWPRGGRGRSGLHPLQTQLGQDGTRLSPQTGRRQ